MGARCRGGGVFVAGQPRLARLAPASSSAPLLLLLILLPSLLAASFHSKPPNMFHFEVFVGKTPFKGQAAALGDVLGFGK